MSASVSGHTEPRSPKTRKERIQDSNLRTSCDGCHAAKIRCSGGTPCTRCARDNLNCHYSQKAKIGKPRGSLNKKTIERLRQMKEKQRCAPQTPPSTAGSMDVSETIPPLPSCGSESNTTISPKESNGHTLHTPPNFALGSPTFHDLIFPEVSQMESWLPGLTDPIANTQDTNPPDISKQPTHQTYMSPTESHNSTALYKPFLESFKESQSHEPSFFPITDRTERISQTCTCFPTLSHHLCTLQANSSTIHSQALDALLIQSQQILPSICSLAKCQACLRDTQTLFLVTMILSRLLKWTHASICTCETRCVSADIRLGQYQAPGGMGLVVTKLLIQAYLDEFEKAVEVFEGTVSRVGCGDDGAYLALQARNFQMEVRGLVERIAKYI